METASTQPGELVSVLPDAESSALRVELRDELWVAGEGQECGISREELGLALLAIGTRCNFGLSPGRCAGERERAAFLRGLRLPEVVLAQACALGSNAAWERFMDRYRTPLTQAAIAITGSSTLGHDLADSLYAELFGLRETGGQRRSPLASYTGRGSLMGWLRTTLAQRHVDHHRRTYRETPLDFDAAAETMASPLASEAAGFHQALGAAVAQTLEELADEERFLLAAYFLDQRTLLQIARLLRVHEATVSRRLKRLTADVRKQLMRNLQARGLSRRAAQEALGADPRDIEVNLRTALQHSQIQPFHDETIETGEAAKRR